jgi:hypothetical protein
MLTKCFKKINKNTNHGQDVDTINDKWNDSSPKQNNPHILFLLFHQLYKIEFLIILLLNIKMI